MGEIQPAPFSWHDLYNEMRSTMPKQKIEQIIDAPSVYPGDVSSFYQPTLDGLLGKPDELQNSIQALIKSGVESGCTVQEVADNLAALFMSTEPKEKVKADG